MKEENSVYYLGGGLILTAIIFWELRSGRVSLSTGAYMGHLMVEYDRAIHPQWYWGAICVQLAIVVFCFVKGCSSRKS